MGRSLMYSLSVKTKRGNGIRRFELVGYSAQKIRNKWECNAVKREKGHNFHEILLSTSHKIPYKLWMENARQEMTGH